MCGLAIATIACSADEAREDWRTWSATAEKQLEEARSEFSTSPQTLPLAAPGSRVPSKDGQPLPRPIRRAHDVAQVSVVGPHRSCDTHGLCDMRSHEWRMLRHVGWTRQMAGSTRRGPFGDSRRCSQNSGTPINISHHKCRVYGSLWQRPGAASRLEQLPTPWRLAQLGVNCSPRLRGVESMRPSHGLTPNSAPASSQRWQ